ncbi:hypothetical protein DCO48_20575 [Pseudomonas sp. SDI]|nr:hypothetical protein DCO48_20575 [Pseudomonas sp. SDI]
MRFVGGAGQALGEWTQRTAMGIKLGKVANITNAPIVQNSGGVLPLVVMVLNLLNARKSLLQLQVVERPDKQRVYDAASTALYAGAALTAVLDNQVRKAIGRNSFSVRSLTTPYMAMFGALIGGLSTVAGLVELESLRIQLESATSVDPWLNMRRKAVGGLVVAYAAQTLAGVYWTIRALAGLSTVSAAIAGYTLWMGPVLIVIAGLGVLYFITWLFQQTPLQNFLANCCWSKNRAQVLKPIAAQDQRVELERLIGILYVPRVSFTSSTHVVSSPMLPRNIAAVSTVDALTIDLPGAEPDKIHMEVAMIGYVIDQEALDGQAAGALPVTSQPPRKWVDVVPGWLDKSRCDWIPVGEGHGLRLAGNFPTTRNLSNPTKIVLRVRYKTPFVALLGEECFVGGKSGLTFTLNYSNGVLSIRDEMPEGTGYQTNYVLSQEGVCSAYLLPRVKNGHS